MKKLMFAAALAAVSTGAFAEEEAGKSYVGYVYDMELTLKTTQCSGKEIKSDLICSTDKVYYRTQVTQKINGVFWGCGCEVIGCPAVNIDWTITRDDDETKDTGFCFWNKKLGLVWNSVDSEINYGFSWEVLNIVGKKAQNVEGLFSLNLPIAIDKDGHHIYTDIVLEGAGYGTASIAQLVECVEAVDATDFNYIKSMKGYVVGKWDATETYEKGEDFGCYYCGGSVGIVCQAWNFCAECTALTTTDAAIFGSWTLKYNSTATKKVRNGKSVIEADSNIPKAIIPIWNAAIADLDD